MTKPTGIWGYWVWNAKYQTLDYPRRSIRYHIPLRNIRTVADIQEWIDQVGDKTWATPQDRADLAQALTDLFVVHLGDAWKDVHTWRDGMDE
jgi:hypothetical protein